MVDIVPAHGQGGYKGWYRDTWLLISFKGGVLSVNAIISKSKATPSDSIESMCTSQLLGLTVVLTLRVGPGQDDRSQRSGRHAADLLTCVDCDKGETNTYIRCCIEASR